MSFPSPESRRIISELAQRLKNLDTLWPTVHSEKMANNAAMYLVVLTMIEQSTRLSSAFLSEVERKDSKEVFASDNCPRVTLRWKDALSTLRKYAPRSIPLLAHVRDEEEIEGVSLEEAVEWVLGLARGKSDDKARPADVSMNAAAV